MPEDLRPVSFNQLLVLIAAVLSVQELLVWVYRTWRDRDRDD